MTKIGIVEYGMGNIDSVSRAISVCGGTPRICNQPEDLDGHDALILPGVGSFNRGMQHLHDRGHVKALEPLVVNDATPVLGICLGMQLLASHGEEGGKTPGLGWIPGVTKKIQPLESERIPHVGWNDVNFRPGSPLEPESASPSVYYFVHSYHFDTSNDHHVVATTPYAGGLNSIVASDNVAGVQFHPEKSQSIGMAFLQNFMDLI